MHSINTYNPNTYHQHTTSKQAIPIAMHNTPPTLYTQPQIYCITTYPPRECGIATYTHDLIHAIHTKFSLSYSIGICAVINNNEVHNYTGTAVLHTLNTDDASAYTAVLTHINQSTSIKVVLIQHEFGLFYRTEAYFIRFLQMLTKPFIIVFHTVIPSPSGTVLFKINLIAKHAQQAIVMTQAAEHILTQQYAIPTHKVSVIPHGTHLVVQPCKLQLKQKYSLVGKKVLATFGLLSEGKNIETTLLALPTIIKEHPNVIFLIIGKTHPTIIKNDGEKYRNLLQEIITKLQLERHVLFINEFLSLPILLEYLQLTDVYLFTSKDPNQAVSGTFAYAISCGCPVVSTPIPHAKEVLNKGAGILINFESPISLAAAVNKLLSNHELRNAISLHSIHQMAPHAWENSAIAHVNLITTICQPNSNLQYNIPPINLNHIKQSTTAFGIVQFSIINKPDLLSGYTIDDNARALIAMLQYYAHTLNAEVLPLIHIYLNYIQYCQKPDGSFHNYTNQHKAFTHNNYTENLDDANGRTIWALGTLLGMSAILPASLVANASHIMELAMPRLPHIYSTRAMAFIIKGLYYKYTYHKHTADVALVQVLATRLQQMYLHTTTTNWQWYEGSFTYGNSTIPEAMLQAYIITGNKDFKYIAVNSFNFLLSKICVHNTIQVISNQNWLTNAHLVNSNTVGGQQPIDVAYTIIALRLFYTITGNTYYKLCMHSAFSWFLGNNHLHQIIYNPCTGGCYDGLEVTYINLNQGAESTISYLLARLSIEPLPSHTNTYLGLSAK